MLIDHIKDYYYKLKGWTSFVCVNFQEMFGKDVVENDQLSEDEDWGPGKKRKKVKESDEKLTDQTNSEMNEVSNDSHQVMPSESQKKKAAFRIPSDAVKVYKISTENRCDLFSVYGFRIFNCLTETSPSFCGK